MTTKLRPMRHKTLNASLLDLLSDRIFSGKLKAGERLNESDLARQLRISRSPIREALHSLEEQGIVINNPRRGMFVVSLSERDVGEISSVRVILEAKALHLCRQNFQSNLERQLGQLVEELDFRDASLETSIRRADLEFHRLIWAHSENEHLAAALTRLTSPLFVYVAEMLNRGKRRKAVAHRPFLQYLQGHSSQTAEEVVLEHVKEGYAFVEGPSDHKGIAEQGVRAQNSQEDLETV
jgi:DNA-binding GntR family transcriptional regulator